ncbi:MAG TPA: helix-turn-helix domain-containing protein [Chitinophagales bacterium]|nr:helix-turn-helix domain-containing protein [Chitinophagales bacterium]
MDIYEIAKDFILNTAESVFLTGKAGTGKTTLLKYIQQHTQKNCVIAAPTGVAAINAGGVTLHSLFQLPLNMYVPVKNRNYAVNNPATLFEHVRLNRQKIQLLREMELLVIDEISMCRCDILDEIDLLLRSFRRRMNEPFGGVQVLFIGDLYQLPPVVKDEEWRILNEFYESPFFFSAWVMKEFQVLHIELETVFRQTDEEFIDLLNAVRNNAVNKSDLDELNKRYNPHAAQNAENTILLTTHNRKADKINQEELSKLASEIHTFEANIHGDFLESSYPADKELMLKVGAQVMFTKNDLTQEKRYYNGKIGTVTRLNEEEIVIKCVEDNYEINVDSHTWENLRYAYNDTTDKIDEDVIGTFEQYPLKLAWAVTIHKSQGLTFDKVIIDAGHAFAAGQVYVALSRCRSLEGISLLTPVQADAIFTDDRILQYSADKSNPDALASLLPLAKLEYSKKKLLTSFSWRKITDHILQFQGIIHEKQIPEKAEAMELAIQMEKSVRNLEEVSAKFLIQLKDILNQVEDEKYRILLNERVIKSIQYFCSKINDELIKPLEAHIEKMRIKNKTKGYVRQAKNLATVFVDKLQEIERLKFGDSLFYTGTSFYQEIQHETVQLKNTTEKGSTFRDTLKLYQEGKSIEEIAGIRALAVSTIESHLLKWIQLGDLEAKEFISEADMDIIQAYVKNNTVNSLTELKNHFEDEYSFFQLRICLNTN